MSKVVTATPNPSNASEHSWIATFTEFPKAPEANPIQVPAAIERKCPISVQLKPGKAVANLANHNDAQPQQPKPKTHRQIYHPEENPAVERSAKSVFTFDGPSNREYQEPYFKQFGGKHMPPVFEILVNNETMRSVEVPEK